MNIPEKLQQLKIDKGQIVIFSVIGLVIMYIVYGLVSSSNDSEQKQTNTNISIPENRTVKSYETKLEAYSKENEQKENGISLNFDRDLLDGNKSDEKDNGHTKKQLLELQIDSMLNSKKFTPNYKKTVVRSVPTNAPKETNAPEIISESENTIDINDFFLKKAKPKRSIGNVGIDSENKKKLNIMAVIHNDQEIRNGDRIKLRLLENVTINGIKYKRNTYAFGFARFQTNRVLLTINNINHNPTNLVCYDKQDGSMGIYVEGANAVGEFGREGTEDVVSDSDISNVPLGNTLKNIFRRKNREISVSLLNNYEVILKEE